MNPQIPVRNGCACTRSCCNRNAVDIGSFDDVDDSGFAARLLEHHGSNTEDVFLVAGIEFVIVPMILDTGLELWSEVATLWLEADGPGCRLKDDVTGECRMFPSRRTMLDELSEQSDAP